MKFVRINGQTMAWIYYVDSGLTTDFSEIFPFLAQLKLFFFLNNQLPKLES